MNSIENFFITTNNIDFNTLNKEQDLNKAKSIGIQALGKFKKQFKKGTNELDIITVINHFKINRKNLNLQIAKCNKERKKQKKKEISLMEDFDFKSIKSKNSQFWKISEIVFKIMHLINPHDLSFLILASKDFTFIDKQSIPYNLMKCYSLFKKTSKQLVNRSIAKSGSDFLCKLITELHIANTNNYEYAGVSCNELNNMMTQFKDSHYSLYATLIDLKIRGKKFKDNEVIENLKKFRLIDNPEINQKLAVFFEDNLPLTETYIYYKSLRGLFMDQQLSDYMFEAGF